MTLPKYPTLNRTNGLIDSLGHLNPKEELLAQLCRDLAERIDTSRMSKTGTTSMALTQLVKQLGTSIEDLLRSKPIEDTFLGWLLNDDDQQTEDDYKRAKAAEHAALITGAA